jgi:DNA-binding NarL/FixJ family response regulator
MARSVLAPDVLKGQCDSMVTSFAGRVLLVEDEEFTRSLLLDGLVRLGIHARAVGSSAEALEILTEFDPNVVISDLNLGAGPSGAALLSRVAEEYPWVGLIALTAHASPALAISDGRTLPESVVYIVKSSLTSVADLIPLAAAAISNLELAPPPVVEGQPVLTVAQGEILRLIAEGYSNAGIAEMRSTSVRAAESQVVRIFSALGIESDPHFNPRVKAVRMWQQGQIIVR